MPICVSYKDIEELKKVLKKGEWDGDLTFEEREKLYSALNELVRLRTIIKKLVVEDYLVEIFKNAK